MGMKDIKILALTLVPVLGLVLLAALAPVYYVPNRGYERHWVWNAPTIKVRHGYEELSPEDLQRLNADPRQKAILDGMKSMPREVPIAPIYIGSRWGPGRNTLGYFAMMSVIAWVAFAGYKWFNR